ncbi:hypothetical protein [Flammeovirga sp. SJP92]|uniref:hypothetical protein n=1 Tax=Flammeovirga sp. SJP92 TaxID=1775430 RepID=UPI000788A10F|nr:hypothetical protein [Flammeovirga sp. SJP92]KXX72056.1 hypothetical protein AVL50_02740 [Flammeovirga sp. SJP92]
MRKGTKRYYGQMITSNKASFVGKELDVIMKNGQSYHGIIKGTNENGFQMKDGLNGKHELSFSDIDEIIEVIPAKY